MPHLLHRFFSGPSVKDVVYSTTLLFIVSLLLGAGENKKVVPDTN
jgi:Na+(H+)/acetate symporter ActP